MNPTGHLPIAFVPLAAGLGFAAGAVLAGVALFAPSASASPQAPLRRSRLVALAGGSFGRRRAADLRLCGIAPAVFAVQRAASTAAGVAAGSVAAALWTTTVTSDAVALAAGAAAGWLLPAQSVRDTARQRRDDVHRAVNAWIVLTAQQVTAGAEPAAAMLASARANDTAPWQLLTRHLQSAQNRVRPAAEGLRELAERYRLDGVDQAVGALELAARRGTRLSDAVLAAAGVQWAHSVAAERETAQRHNQIIALPATAVALALAAILIYPPLVSLTGGIVASGT
ncbi:hypothetical protein [Candidatus Poriferisodalis sp.]|uniref:hypothetical protein n=1 Tax=Candidatus Poriferisodalis sp. TaxID=3101277 RepID=UPI003B025E3B